MRRRSYNNGVRTGLGVYTFSKNGARKVSGTYAGEWLKGSFHGLGSLTYSDGEMYIGAARGLAILCDVRCSRPPPRPVFHARMLRPASDGALW